MIGRLLWAAGRGAGAVLLCIAGTFAFYFVLLGVFRVLVALADVLGAAPTILGLAILLGAVMGIFNEIGDY